MRFALDFDDILKSDKKEDIISLINDIAMDTTSIYVIVKGDLFEGKTDKEKQEIVRAYKEYLKDLGIHCDTVVVSNDSIDKVCSRNFIDILFTSNTQTIESLKDNNYITTYNLGSNNYEDFIELKKIIEDSFATAMPNKNISGIPSEDKSWIKYYNNQSVKIYERLAEENQATGKSMFQTIVDANQDFLHEIALKYDDEVTYGELFKKVNELKYSLSRKYGLKKGEKVAILSPNTLATVYSIFATQDLGLIPSMIHVYTPAEDLHKYFVTEGITYVITIGLESTYNNVKKAIEGTSVKKVFVVPLSDSLKGVNVIKAKIGTSRIYKLITNMKKLNRNYKLQKNTEVSMSSQKYLKELIKIINSCSKKFKIDYNDTFIDWREVVKNGYGAPLVPSSSDEIAVIMHTGGTTGTAKSTPLTHQNIIANADAFQAKIQEFKRQDSLITIPPLFHVLGFNNCLYLLLRVGGTIVLVNKYDKKALPRLFKREKPEYFFAVPKIGRDMLALKDLFTEDAFSNLKYVVFGGEEVPEAFIKDFNDLLSSKNSSIKSSQSLGATEASCSMTVTFNGSNEEGSIGIPLINSNVKVVKVDEVTDKITELSYGEIGEICFTGPSIMTQGYLSMKEETDLVLKQHSDGNIWYHTGDLGYISESGMIYFVDRCKEMQKINGEQVFPSKIKKVILENPAVASCAIAFISDEQYKKKSLALVTLKEEYRDKESEVKAEILEKSRMKLTKESVPYYLEIRDSLPETMYYKINNKEIQKEFEKKLVLKKSN